MTVDFGIDRVKKDFNEFTGYAERNRDILLYTKKPIFEKYSPVYTFTTENLESYFIEMNLEDRKCLTVASSGDQIINLALMGAKKIDCFDYNRITYYIVKLKLAALQALTYQEFIDYFTSLKAHRGHFLVNENFFSYELYKKICEYLEEDVKLFFDMLYDKYEYDGMKIKDARIIYNLDDYSAMYNNIYLKNEEIYIRARILVKKIIERGISFHEMDIYEIVNLTDKYNIILLSNIFDYIGQRQEKYAEFVENDLTRIVEPDGTIILNYQYGYRQRKEPIMEHNAVYVTDDDDRYFPNVTPIAVLSDRSYTIIGVPSIWSSERENGIEDAVYTFTFKPQKK